MISKKCKYGLRAILYLASHKEEGKKHNVKDVASVLDLPAPYLSKVLQELAAVKIISSSKGPKGGFYMTDQNIASPLIEIIKAIDGEMFFRACGLGLHQCNDKRPCPMHNQYAKARGMLESYFLENTIATVSTEVVEGHLYLTS